MVFYTALAHFLEDTGANPSGTWSQVAWFRFRAVFRRNFDNERFQQDWPLLTQWGKFEPMKLKIDSESVPNFSLIQCPGRFDGKNHMRYQIMSSKIIKCVFLDIGLFQNFWSETSRLPNYLIFEFSKSDYVGLIKKYLLFPFIKQKPIISGFDRKCVG